MSILFAFLAMQASSDDRVLYVPTPLPEDGAYQFECAMARDDFTLERVSGTYSQNSRAPDVIEFNPESESAELAGKRFLLRYYKTSRKSEGGEEQGKLWTFVALPGAIPIVGEEFTFELYQDERGPFEPGIIPGSLLGSAICRRSSEPQK